MAVRRKLTYEDNNYKDEQYTQKNTGANPASEYSGVEYDASTDYMAKLNDALKRGNYDLAARYENQRNAKIDGEGLSYTKTHYTYTPQYDEQINSLLDKLLNREGFNYNAEIDPLYQQYKELYTQQGKLAMQDAMGQAAALTGGYGSSYSQAVGQQQYDAYLQKLNEVVPELYSQAYSQYEAEGDRLKDVYSLLLSKDASDYDRAQNNYSRYLQQSQTTQSNARDEVDAILQAGGTPSADLISKAGYSAEYINSLRNYYAQQAAQSSGRSSGGGGGSSRKKTSGTPTDEASTTDYKGMRDTLYYGKQLYGTDWAQAKFRDFVNSENMSEAQAKTLAKYVGLDFDD